MEAQLFDKIQASVKFIQNISNSFQPQAGIILGTGLGSLVEDTKVHCEIAYEDIPHFPISTVESHAGKLILGTLNEMPVAIVSGRFHFYEGYSMEQVTYPVRVLKFLGLNKLIITNASGGLQAHYNGGDIVCVTDHINLQPINPLRGHNDDRLGPRFPDMMFAYNPDRIEKAMAFAAQENIPMHKGIYVCLQGPSLETPSEYAYAHKIGGDAVGMSTVPEVIVAKHMDMNVLVLSLVTNVCYPVDTLTPTTLEEVIEAAKLAAPKMKKVIMNDLF